MRKKNDMTYMEQIQYNQKQRKNYYAGVWKDIIRNGVISGILGILIALEHSSDDVFLLSSLWGPAADIGITGCLFVASQRPRTHLLNGKTVKNIPLELLFFATAMIPWFYTVWLRIGPAFGWSFFKCIWMTPVTLVIVLIGSLFMNAKDARFDFDSGSAPFSIQEMRYAKQNMELAGLNSNQAGMLTSVAPGTVRSMSVQDWYRLGQKMELAGYDHVFKKH